MDIGKSIQESINLYRQNFSTLLLATFIVFVGSALTIGILSGPLVGGLLLLCLKLMRGEQARVNEVFAHFNKFGSTFLIVAAMWAAALITAVLASVPVVGNIVRFIAGPFIGMVFTLAIGLALDRNIEAVEALRQALGCFKTNPLMIWLYSFIIGLLSGIGAILFVVPVIFTMPIGAAGMAIAYRELISKEGGVPNSGTNIMN